MHDSSRDHELRPYHSHADPLKPYVDRLGNVVFLTEAQFHARREHSDVREIRDHELKQLALGNARISTSVDNPTARNLIREKLSERLVTLTVGEDCKTGEMLYLNMADGKVYRASANTGWDLIALADYTKGQVVQVPLEFKANTKPLTPIRSRLSVAFASCLDFCKEAYGDEGDIEDYNECEAWITVMKDLISEVNS